MPETASSRQDIESVADQLCGVSNAESVPPSSDLEAAMAADKESQPTTNELLQLLNILLTEAIDEVSEAKALMQNWKSMLTQDLLKSVSQKVVNGLQIPSKDYVGVNPDMNSPLHILLQLACYIRFLKSQENDAAYGDLRTQIKDALFKMVQMGRIVRRLLPFSDADIKSYVMQGISDRVLVLEKCVSAIKRAICCVAVEVILGTLTKIRVSLSSNSVILA